MPVQNDKKFRNHLNPKRSRNKAKRFFQIESEVSSGVKA